MSDETSMGFVAFNPTGSGCVQGAPVTDWSQVELPATVKAERDRLRAELEKEKAAFLALTSQYLSLTDAMGYHGGDDAQYTAEEWADKLRREIHSLRYAALVAREALFYCCKAAEGPHCGENIDHALRALDDALAFTESEHREAKR